MQDMHRDFRLHIDSINDSQLHLADPLFAISTAPGVEHVVSDSELQFIRVDDRIPYPETSQFPGSQEMLLGRVNNYQSPGRYLLELPNNYATMAQALNDAIGEDPTETSMQMAKGLFADVGNFVSRVAIIDGVLPRSLDYRQIIFPRDIIGVQIIPPLSFEAIAMDDKRGSLESFTNQVLQLCYSAVRDERQRRNLDEAFEGFKETFHF